MSSFLKLIFLHLWWSSKAPLSGKDEDIWPSRKLNRWNMNSISSKMFMPDHKLFCLSKICICQLPNHLLDCSCHRMHDNQVCSSIPLQFWACWVIPIAHKVLFDLTGFGSIQNDSLREVCRCFLDHSFSWFRIHLLGVCVPGTSYAMMT